MQQTVMKLKAQCSEKGFELEIKSADNRVLQEQLQTKCAENKELEERIIRLEQQLASVPGDNKSSPENHVPDEYTEELRKRLQSQEIENEKLKLERVQILEDNSGLHVQNQKLSEEASYAKELASAAAVELKNLAGEVTKLSLQNAKLEKELQAARELSSRNFNVCIDPFSKASRLSLLDRGFVFAVGHVRGGGEMGRPWYKNGKLLKKKDTFTDFIDCAEYLIEKKCPSKEKICMEGRSAGGLLAGAVMNMWPDLFKAVVAGVPFVDVLTTMLDHYSP